MVTTKTKDSSPTVEALTQQVAKLILGGASVTDCAKQLAVTPTAVRAIQQTDEYKEIATFSLAKMRAQLEGLTPKAIKAISDVLDTGSSRDKVQAATIVFKAVGLSQEEKQQQDTSITVIMPGSETPRTIEVQDEET